MFHMALGETSLPTHGLKQQLCPQHRWQTFSKKSTAESFFGGFETWINSSDPDPTESRHMTYATSDSKLDSVMYRNNSNKYWTTVLAVSLTRLCTIGDYWTFPIPAARTWNGDNSLPPEVMSSRTLPSFKSQPKTYLFSLPLTHYHSDYTVTAALRHCPLKIARKTILAESPLLNQSDSPHSHSDWRVLFA